MKTFGLNYDIQHNNRVELIARNVNQLYLNTIRDITRLAEIYNIDISKPFVFSEYPEINRQVDKLISNLSAGMKGTIDYGTKNEWIAACKKNDFLIESIAKSTGLKPERIAGYSNRNIEALQSFQTRKIGGLNLSEKVWKYANQFKGDIELGLDIGIGDGRSAAELSRDLRSYLQEPQKLFRRVADKHGVLRLSQNAKKYSPDTGVYRSSYKNAMRLTRTEVNMAYRTSDYERIQELDFVVGIEIRRSNHIFACPVCEALKGKYPKTFKFTGWHPQCRCHQISILATNEEFLKHQQDILAGNESELKSVNHVSDIPANFKTWIKDNQERIDNAKSKPYFIKDNEQFIAKKKKEPYVYSDSSFDKLRSAGVTVRTEQLSAYSYKVNMGEFDLSEFNDDVLSLCNKNNISLDEVYLVNDLGKMKLSFYGYYDGNKLKPFTMERSFKREDGVISVTHDRLVVPEDLQGNGISKELFRSLYKQYGNAGVEKISVHANMEVGGYTWGKYGFTADKSYASKLYGHAKSAAFDGLLTDKEFSEISKYLNDCMNKKMDVDMHFIACRSYGKKLLLKSDWGGSIDLTDIDRRSIFEKYIFGR